MKDNAESTITSATEIARGGLNAGLAFLDVCINTKALIPISDMPICPRRRTKNNILLMVSPLKNEREGGSTNIGISLSNLAVFWAINWACPSQTSQYPIIPRIRQATRRAAPETQDNHLHLRYLPRRNSRTR